MFSKVNEREKMPFFYKVSIMIFQKITSLSAESIHLALVISGSKDWVGAVVSNVH